MTLQRPEVLQSVILKEPSIIHGFFTRQHGVSPPPYDSFNCSITSADDIKNINENCARALETFRVNDNVHTLKLLSQVHSSDVVIVEDAHINTEAVTADALITALPGLAVGVYTADCCPVLFFATQSKIAGAAHAGWRGALTGILGNTIKKILSLGAKESEIKAAIGPTIAQHNYEVDHEFHRHFLKEDPSSERFFAEINHKFSFDLPGYCRHQLLKSGLNPTNIEDIGIDTYSSPKFFSFRRATHKAIAQGDTHKAKIGSQLSAIAIRG
jgi:YfiH family protein